MIPTQTDSGYKLEINNKTTINNEKLLSPCPFCGSFDLSFLKKKSSDGTITWVRILHGLNTECSVSMIDTSEEKVISKWNQRI